MLKRLIVLLMVLAPVCAFGQGQAIPGLTAQKGPGNIQRVLPFSPIVVCGYPATGGTPCTNLAQTYTSPNISTSCPSTAQVVSPATTTCMGTSDGQGNFEFFAAGGSSFTYYFRANNTWFGPYVVTTGSTGSVTNNPGGLAGQIQCNGGTVFCAFTASGDATINTGTGVVTVTGTNGSALPASATVVGTNSSKQIVPSTVQGNGPKVQLSTGSTTLGDCPVFDANGNIVDSGAGCGGNPPLNAINNPTGNSLLTTGTHTTLFTSGDFGASPVTGVFNLGTTATSSTDTSYELSITSPANSYHNPFISTVGANQVFGICSTGGASPIGFVVVGIFTPSMVCSNLTQAPFSRFWDIVATSSHVDATFYEAANGYTANLVQMFAHTAAGTGFNFLVTCAGANNTGGTCTSPLDTIRGDGQLTVPSFVLNGSTAFTSVQGNGAKLQASTGTTTSGDCVKFDANGNTVDAGAACGSGGSGFPSGVGLAGATVSGTGSTSQAFIPTVDVRWFFTNPFPTYAQAQSQDFGAVLNAAFVAATSSGACVDASGLNLLNAPNVTVLYASTNPFAGLTSNTYTPCLLGANFQVVTAVTWATPAGALRIEGGVPGGIGGTGLVIQPCNTNPTCNGAGGFTVNQFPTSGVCAASGGVDCYATGLPSSTALAAPYSTGTVTCTNGLTTCTGSGTSWTTANILVGAYFVSSCGANTCTPGSTSTYVSGRIVAVNAGTQTITLQAAWAGGNASAEKYLVYNPNTSVAFCDGCLGSSLQKSFTGHQIKNLTIDLNGISGAGFYTKSSQEGSILDNYTCFLQFGPVTAYTVAGGTCLAWDQSLREASGSGQTFLGHWSVYGGRIGMGQNVGGSSAFGVVVEGFSIMDGSVALSQANGPSVFELQAIIGGGGSAKFQDAAYIDGISGMFISGTHTESALNDHWNLGPNNPVYNINLNAITSSGTLGGSVVELHTGTSGNQVHGVSRPSGGILITDDNLTSPTVGVSVSATPASWTITEYLQQGNASQAIVASGNVTITGTMTANNFQWVGPIYISGPIPGTAMSPSTSGNSAIGISSDGNLYVSNNAAAIDEVCTHGNGACPTGGGGTVGSSDVTGQSTSQTSTSIATSPTAGNYNLRFYADTNTACSTGANTVSFTLNWTDATAARTLTTGSLNLGSTGTSSYLSGEIPIRVAVGNVTYTSTVTGACGTGSSSYDVHMVLTQ